MTTTTYYDYGLVNSFLSFSIYKISDDGGNAGDSDGT